MTSSPLLFCFYMRYCCNLRLSNNKNRVENNPFLISIDKIYNIKEKRREEKKKSWLTIYYKLSKLSLNVIQ